jgi:hypothetical protein
MLLSELVSLRSLSTRNALIPEQDGWSYIETHIASPHPIQHLKLAEGPEGIRLFLNLFTSQSLRSLVLEFKFDAYKDDDLQAIFNWATPFLDRTLTGLTSRPLTIELDGDMYFTVKLPQLSTSVDTAPALIFQVSGDEEISSQLQLIVAIINPTEVISKHAADLERIDDVRRVFDSFMRCCPSGCLESRRVHHSS